MKKTAAVEVNAYLSKRPSLFKKLKTTYPFLIMLLPGFIALALFAYKPLYGLLIAFKDYKIKLGVTGSPWADNNGMEWFIRLFKGSNFKSVMTNTITISALSLVLQIPCNILLALLINEMRGIVYKRFIQTITYIPYFFSWVVLGGIFKTLFSITGPINSIITDMGMEPVKFLENDGAFFVLLMVSRVWQSVGWGAVIYIAALAGVDESLYEAAYIDGAGKLKQVFHISIPSIMGTITTVFIMSIGSILNAGFDQIMNMMNPLVREVSQILDTYSIELLQRGGSVGYGVGTALGLFKGIVGLILVLASNKVITIMSKDEFGIL